MKFSKQALEPFGSELLTLEVPTKLGFKMPLVFRLTRLLEEKGLIDPSRRSLAELCFDEALANAMVHGNKLDRTKKVRVRLFCDDSRWGAIVEDEGEGFAPADVPEPGEDDFVEEKGRGIMIMDGYLDELVYSEKGNRLMMIRRRERAEKPEAVRARTEETRRAGLTSVSRSGDVAVIEVLAPRIHGDNVEAFKSEVEQALEESESLLFDLSSVEYMSSAGIGALALFLKRVRSKGGDLKICAVQPPVLEVFKVVHFDRLIDMLPDKDAALAKFRQSN